MGADQVLEVAGVVVRYGERAVVDGASFTMSRARVLALLGANGAGKTSLLQVCEGFRRPDAGRVRVLDLDPWSDRGLLMPRLGIMLQSGGVYPTAFTSLAIGTGYERAYGALKRLGASPLTRLGLIVGKTSAVVLVTLGQALVLAAIGVALGWRPALGGIPGALGVSVLAVTAFAGLGLLLAARLRPETTTGAATVLYVLLLAVSGVMFPLPELGRAELVNPLAAYAETLRLTLSYGQAAQPWAWYGLGLWAVLSVYAAALGFRWE